MVRPAHDDMVQHFDLHQLPGSDQVSRGSDVGFAWGRVATGMIVHEDDGGGRRDDCGAENFPRMAEQRVGQADRDQVMALDAPPRVQHQNHQAFHFGIEIGMRGNMALPVLDRALGVIAQSLVLRHWAFAQGGDLVFVGRRRKPEWFDKLQLRP